MSILNIPLLFIEDRKEIAHGVMINPQRFELPMSRTIPWSQICSSHWTSTL